MAGTLVYFALIFGILELGSKSLLMIFYQQTEEGSFLSTQFKPMNSGQLSWKKHIASMLFLEAALLALFCVLYHIKFSSYFAEQDLYVQINLLVVLHNLPQHAQFNFLVTAMNFDIICAF